MSELSHQMNLLCIQVIKSALAHFMLQHVIIIIDMSELSYQIKLLRIEGNKSFILKHILSGSMLLLFYIEISELYKQIKSLGYFGAIWRAR